MSINQFTRCQAGEKEKEREREKESVCVRERVQHYMNINIECDMHVYMYNYVGGIQSEWSTIGNSLHVFPRYDPVVVTPMEHPQVSEQPIFDCLPHQQHAPKCHHLNQQDPLCHQAEAHCLNLRHEVMCAHTCPVVNSQPPTPCLSVSLSHTLTLFPPLTLVSQHTGSMTYMHTACTICVTPMICLSHTQVYLCFVRLYTLIPRLLTDRVSDPTALKKTKVTE